MTKSLFFLLVVLPVVVPMAAMHYLRLVNVAEAPLLAQVAAAIGVATWETVSETAAPRRSQRDRARFCS
ncbi:hypothetical protein [Dyella sp.]|uniref:hypothetical protein n=1 Tax=Dyella sp. TaxID=1869338 RepID=UPI002D793F47|nr:hypothetical protein [Dyella sp.]HET6433783.1 hypothetical protein [Dyella sp.]